MANRLSIFEFVSNKNITDYISEFLRELSLTESGMEGRISPYAKDNAIKQGTELINKLEHELTLRPVPNYNTVIYPDYYKLHEFYSQAMKELEPKFKTLELHLAQIYPEQFTDRDELLQAAQLANNDSTVMALNPSKPAPGDNNIVDAEALTPARYRHKSFNSALGVDNIKNTFGQPDANKVYIPGSRQ